MNATVSMGQMEGQHRVSLRECLVIQLLADDGWGTAELAMVLERKKTTITTHRDGNCAHGGTL